MLLSTIVICCIVAANAESPLNSYPLVGDNNVGYDYGNAVANSGYLAAKDSYQNALSIYSAGDINQKLSNHVAGHSLINSANQGSVGDDVGTSYGKYSANDQGNEYAGYTKTYESPDSDAYALSSHAASIPLGGGYPDNRESIFNAAYAGGSVHKDHDFGQFAAGSSTTSQRVSPYPGYPFRPSVLENSSEGAGDALNAPGYRAPSGTPGYPENAHVYHLAYSPGSPTNEYSLVEKQRDGFAYHAAKGSGKYDDVHPVPSHETRYTRGNTGYSGRDHGASPYLSTSGPSGGHSAKAYGSSGSPYSSSGKPHKHSYKHLSRYAPNGGATYPSRERDFHYAPTYGKGGGKVIVIKDSRPSYGGGGGGGGRVHSDESPYAGGGYRSRNGAGGYSAPSNLDGYSGTGGSYDDAPAMPRRYRNSVPILVQRTVYS